jgi:hypothetical protein
MSIQEKVCVKVLGSMITYATNQIAMMDEEFGNKFKQLNEIVQWKIGDDIAYYTEIKDGKIKEFEGISKAPTLTFEISDVSKALEMLTGRIDTSSLAKVITVSDPMKAAKLAFITQTVAKYLKGLSA